MSKITIFLAILVALEFVYIMYLETIATQSKATARTFSMAPSELSRPSVVTLFKNQGIYNLLISVLIIIALITASRFWLAIFMIYIILVAIYGGLTSSKSIILKQGGLAILTLLSILFL